MSPNAKYEGLTAKIVVVAKWKISPEPNKVVMSMVQKGRLSHISINPSFLIPWIPVEGNKVVIIRYNQIGQVGKLVKLDHRCCAIELASSSELSHFIEADVVNVLKM